MIWNKKKIKIKINKIKINKYKKLEFNKIILKSIIQNKNVKPVVRSNAIYKLSQLKKINFISKQKNVCMYSGKIKSIFDNYKMSRHFIKKLYIENNLQNNRIINW